MEANCNTSTPLKPSLLLMAYSALQEVSQQERHGHGTEARLVKETSQKRLRWRPKLCTSCKTPEDTPPPFRRPRRWNASSGSLFAARRSASSSEARGRSPAVQRSGRASSPLDFYDFFRTTHPRPQLPTYCRFDFSLHAD